MIKRMIPAHFEASPGKHKWRQYGIAFAEDEKYYYWKSHKNKIYATNKRGNYDIYTGSYFTIYIITNDINNKFYIGQTSQRLSSRFGGHIYSAKTKKFYNELYKDMAQYGIEHFHIESLVKLRCVSTITILTLENMFMDLFCTKCPFGYNIKLNWEGKKNSLWYDIVDYSIETKNTQFYDIVKDFLENKIKLKNWEEYENIDLQTMKVENYY